jgi:hypothetical protein
MYNVGLSRIVTMNSPIQWIYTNNNETKNKFKNICNSATPPTTGVGEDVGKKEPFYTVGGNVD